MKKQIAVGAIILITLIAVVGCTQSNSSRNNGGIDKVYLLSGGDEFIEINNGAIILTPNLEQFIGGDLSFKGDEPSNMRNYTTKFYFYMDGIKNSFNLNTVGIEGSEQGISISTDVGSTSAGELFTPEVWGIITEAGALHFSISGTLMDGANFEYSIILSVNEVFSGS